MTCVDCGNEITKDLSSAVRRGGTCFRCHVAGIKWGFRGAGGGRDSFHNETIRELQDEVKRGAAEDGVKIEPKPVRAELI